MKLCFSSVNDVQPMLVTKTATTATTSLAIKYNSSEVKELQMTTTTTTSTTTRMSTTELHELRNSN